MQILIAVVLVLNLGIFCSFLQECYWFERILFNLRKIQMFKKILIVWVISFFILGLSGCADENPTKPAGPGGGRQQPFDPNTGRYK